MLTILIFVLTLTGLLNAMPLTNDHFVDLTHTFEKSNVFPGGEKIFKIDQVITEVSEFFDVWYKAELYSQHSHTGTHMDAPSHWVPNGTNIDEMPVSQFYGPASVIDITQKARVNPDAEVTIEDLLEWESGTGQNLNGSIVLIRTGWEKRYKDRAEYMGTAGEDRTQIHYPGISGEACRWLVDNRSIKGLGSDTFSPESGAKFFNKHLDCHEALLPNGIFILESVAVKKEMPLYGAFLSALPQKLIRGSGAPTRIVASYPEVVSNLP